MADRLKDKVAVVTGSGRGIGRAIVMALAEEGAKVVVNNPTAEKADEVVDEIKAKGGVAIPNYDSVATYEGGTNIINAAVDSYGKIDILVNNAGVLRDRMIFNMTPEEWDIVIKVHLYGAFNCGQPASKLMRQQRSGRIINIISGVGVAGGSGQANYGAAKAGMAGFTRVCARDLGRYGITVNAVHPSAATRMTLSDTVLDSRKVRAERGVAGSAAVSRDDARAEREALMPEDAAPIVVYLASDAAAHINGQLFAARGGIVALYSHPAQVKTIYKEGRWTLDELLAMIPTTLTAGLVNPAPPQPPKQE
jgi:NAD(P)-dependent dehydrogenase (short-subunit alcohol dehydrogenase family)